MLLLLLLLLLLLVLISGELLLRCHLKVMSHRFAWLQMCGRVKWSGRVWVLHLRELRSEKILRSRAGGEAVHARGELLW